ncbi:hypothetical protein O9X90_14845 [Agrobacterium leguminum]|uniref:Uncharacterized protein n=1 Tax=Agrobacterium deltaense Zutra 3/1 TaxID=1183427 RepID=A0A1S7P2B8_9HYPH|nr:MULTISPECIES: hypothetical protein [Agrobacterium]MCZ7933591.1 hypothetical protein [Agrobacterium leguminum]CUX14815.1 conserved membrane hypothetical protein [Agrobacterium deltaense Zutra 3/1]
MADHSGTGFFENLKLVYHSYGGWRSFVSSAYTWIAIVVTTLTWPKAVDGKWVETTLQVLPTLAGFSIAAYAVYFSVLSERDREALLEPEPTMGDRSPFLVLVSGISHAVFVQICGILAAIIFAAKPFPTPAGFAEFAKGVNIALSLAGMFLSSYGIILIIAAVFSIFKVLHIKATPPKTTEAERRQA